MIQSSTFTFLKELKAHNHKEWFHEHKPRYQAAKDDFSALTRALIEGLSEIDPEIRASALEPKQCVLRINRDIRFSADKTPYKTNFFAMMQRGGRKSPFSAYYLSLAPGDVSFMGGGVYLPDSQVLKNIRMGISQHWPEWQALVQDPAFQATFPEGVKTPEKLSRPPKGFDKDDPALAYIQHKGYYTQYYLKDADLMQEDFVKKALEIYQVSQPLVQFLNRAIEG